MKAEHSVLQLCPALGGEPFGLLRRAAPPGPRAQADAQLQAVIQAVDEQHRGRYGARRIPPQLRRQGRRHRLGG